jgi:hypothetical protein
VGEQGALSGSLELQALASRAHNPEQVDWNPHSEQARLKVDSLRPFSDDVSIRLVNGFACRNCADEELAKRGIDPAHPNRPIAGSEVFVSPIEADKNRYGDLPLESGSLGSRVNIRA